MCFGISRSVENSPEMVSNKTAMFTLLSHANLADILGDTDFDFDFDFDCWFCIHVAENLVNIAVFACFLQKTL